MREMPLKITETIRKEISEFIKETLLLNSFMDLNRR